MLVVGLIQVGPLKHTIFPWLVTNLTWENLGLYSQALGIIIWKYKQRASLSTTMKYFVSWHGDRFSECLHLPSQAIRLAFLIAIFCAVPSACCSGGDDFSNNLFSDLSPLIALFGDQVTKQYLSDSMGWADHVCVGKTPLVS